MVNCLKGFMVDVENCNVTPLVKNLGQGTSEYMMDYLKRRLILPI